MPDAKVAVQVAGEPLDPAVLGLLQRVEVRESDREPTLAALRFHLTQSPDGSFRPIDDDVFEPAVALAVDAVAPGGLPSHMFSGYVTHVRPHFEGIESNCYVEVLAQDASVLLNAEERVDSYPDSSDSDAAATVFDRYRITFSGEDTSARHSQDRNLLVQRATDWSFVQRLARRNGFVCYLEPDDRDGDVVAHFRRPAVDVTTQADLVVIQEGANLRWLDLQYSMSGPARHAGAAIDPIEKRIVRGAGEPVLAALGASLLGQTAEDGLVEAGASSATALLRDPVPTDEGIGAEASGATDVDQFAIEARGELDPARYRGLLRARRPVLVRGVGKAFAGAYYVRSVRTTLEDGVLAQTFVASRNASDLQGGEEFGQSAEEVPPE